MKPYMPLDGQLIGLQHRLMRAARAFLDPELQLGLVKPEEAVRFLMDEVVLSEPMARQEVERYTFRSPGQATSYFYGYLRWMELKRAWSWRSARASTASATTTSCWRRACCRRQC